ncbi:MAG TPA: metallophosphoesterase [Gemmatimonadaceae bacterium]|jgi:3',5'-cyclic AMP phosphodiesterase CpdA|nr:metallophosphoesterase [Gemmatimonadaceae bacterium]
MIAAALVVVTGIVFNDANGNGRRDAGESGVPNVVVSDQRDVVVTDANGAFRISAADSKGVVFVSVPDGWRAVGSFWRPASDSAISFALASVPRVTSFTFVHGSDTHVSSQSVGRMRRFRTLTDSIAPSFVIVTGDLVRDALRVGEKEATGYYELFDTEARQFKAPVWTVPGNHENFGIERDTSHVDASHPLYGRGMYHHFRGPDYYSFTFGGVHFVGLNTVDIDDKWYYGHVDSTQLAWLAKDLARIPASMPVVTFDHIPFFTAVESINGYMAGPPAPSLITVNGVTTFRHSVGNAKEVLSRFRDRHLVLALGGHMHVRERLLYEIDGFPTRFEQSAAIVGPSGDGALRFKSGFVVYRVQNGVIDAGTFVPLDPVVISPTDHDHAGILDHRQLVQFGYGTRRQD